MTIYKKNKYVFSINKNDFVAYFISKQLQYNIKKLIRLSKVLL
jgi:hypothetical protein